MGAFVYQRKNVARKGADACEVACKRWACELQSCIATLPVSASTARMDVSVCQVRCHLSRQCLFGWLLLLPSKHLRRHSSPFFVLRQVFMDKWNKCCDTIKAGEVQKPLAGE